MSLKPIHILLVEDHPGDARLLREALNDVNRARFEIHHAERLNDALPLFQEHRFDLVLLDLTLPDSIGLNTVMTAHEYAGGVAIVVLTGMEDEQLGLRAVQAGAQDYLVKGQMDGPLLARTLSYAIERNRLQQEIRALSLMDELTGLYNRRGFMTLAQQQIESANRSGALLLILFVDLDDMKRINDTLGHAAGDAALRETASLLRQTFRGSDILARIGGDEFAVMAMDMHGGHAERLAERLTRAVAERNRQADLAFQLSLSLGVTCYNPAAPRTLQELIDHADALMYQHKRARKEGRAPAVAHLF